MLSEAPLEALQPATLEARRNVQGFSEERLGIGVGFDPRDRRQTQVGSRAWTSCDLPNVVLLHEQPGLGHPHGDHGDGGESLADLSDGVGDLGVSLERVLILRITMHEDDVGYVTQAKCFLKAVHHSQPGWLRQATQVGRGDPDLQAATGTQNLKMLA